MNGFRVFTLVIFVCFASQIYGQIQGNPDNWCREGFFTRDAKNFGIGIVKGKKGTRVFFHEDDTDKCPEGASCRTSSYVISDDIVITNRTRGDFVCAWYSGVNGNSKVGWLKRADLEFPEMVHDSSEPVWIGEWRYASNSISFTSNKLAGSLNVKGNAVWKGLGDNVHVGELDGRFPIRNGVVEYSDGDSEFDCKATMRLVAEKYLIVADNMNCGGANVTFSGIYRKVSSKRTSK